MKQAFYLLISFLLFHLPGVGQEIIPGEFIVRLEKGGRIESFLSAQEGTAFRLKRTLSPKMNIHLLGVEDFSRSRHQLALLKKSQGLVAAQFNHQAALRQGQATIPQDSLFQDQWALNNTGQSGGLVDADIDAVEAWDVTLGGQTVLGDTLVVAVIDDGFFLNHEDILFWKNKNEIPNNGLDDDQNGYIDDYDGWNAYEHNGQIQSDDHGTEVAGIIAGIADNQKGIAGVGWRTAVMPVMGLSASEATVVEAYDYILTQRLLYEVSQGQKGAFVVATNASFGIDRGNPADYPIWCGIFDFLGEAGILNVAATANSNLNVDQVGDIPTACTSDYLITVTSSNILDQRVGGSAFGPISIDLAAPGSGILTTFAGNTYGTASGTSFAAPMVAGTIPLIFAAACPRLSAEYLNAPAEKALVIKNLLLQGTDPRNSLANEVLTGGRLSAIRPLNLLQVLCPSQSGDCVPPYRLLAQALSETEIHFSWVEYQDSLRAKLRYRPDGSATWTDSLIIEGMDSTLDAFSGCTYYEWQVASSCGGGWSDYAPIQKIRSLGCCEAPSQISLQKTDSSVELSWKSQLGAEYYEWQYRTEGSGAWLGDSTSDTTLLISGLMPCTNYEFRLWTICARAPLDTTNILFTSLGCGSCTDLPYCEARGTDVSIEWIDSVGIGTIQLQSGKNGGYGDFTGQNFTLLIDSGYQVFLGPGYDGGTFTEKWRIWIDLDYNGAFDSTELLLDPEARQGEVLDTLRIPPGTLAGTARMRVAMRWAGFDRMTVPEACGVFVEGEVEDYCVKLKIGTDTYCESGSDAIGAEWIEKVEIDTTAFISGLASSGYQFFTNEIFVSKGQDIPLGLIPQSLLPQQGYWRLWGDWNRNGEFEADELWVDIFQNEIDTLEVLKKLPTNSELGPTRLRVALRRDSLPVVCGNFRFGEVEDYVLNISEANSLEDVEKAAIRIYPNPSKGVWQVEGAFLNPGTMELYDNRGRKLVEQKIVPAGNVLSGRDLEKGLYFLNIQTARGSQWFKLVKN